MPMEQDVWIGSLEVARVTYFQAVANQNGQREVVAGKAVASSSGSATERCHSDAGSGQAFMAHHTLKVQQGLHVKGAQITVNKS